MKRYILLIVLIGQLFSINAANRTWIAAAPGNWSNPANWSGGAVPTSVDDVFFDATSTFDCNIDVDVNILSINIAATYSGTIIQNTNSIIVGIGNAVIAGGVFSGGTADITIDGSFTLSGGVFTSTSATFTILQDDFNYTGGTFNNNNGTVNMQLPNAFSGNDPVLSHLIISNNGNFNLNTDITVLDLLEYANLGNIIVNTGTIEVKGDIQLDNTGAFGGGTGTILINGTANQNINSTVNFGRSNLPNVTFDKPSGTLTLIGNTSVNGIWTYIQGFVDGNGYLAFVNSNTFQGPSHSLPNVAFLSGSYTLSSNINVRDTLYCTGSGNITLNTSSGSEIFNKTYFRIDNSGSFGGGNINIRLDGSGDQVIEGLSAPGTGLLPNLIIDKASGSVELWGDISIAGDWEYVNGNVNPDTSNVYFYGAGTIDGEGLSQTMEFYNATLGNINGRTLLGNLIIQNQLTLNSGNIDINTHDIEILNSSTTAISRSGGYLISETDPTLGYGRLIWHIRNSGPGNNYTVPFGVTPINYIPIEYNIQIAGNEITTGKVVFSTYPTDPNGGPPNNRPLPTGVTNLNDNSNNENAANVLDRFWVIEPIDYNSPPTAELSLSYRDLEWSTGINSISESDLNIQRWELSFWDTPYSTIIDTGNNKATSFGGISEYSIFILSDDTTSVTNFSISRGLVFQDSNGNCVYDPSESIVPNTLIDINPGGAVFTDQNGLYSFVTDTGDYTVSFPSRLSSVEVSCPSSREHFISLNTFGQVSDSNDFAIETTPTQDLRTSISCGITRPGFQQNISFSVSNDGTTPMDGTIVFELDSNLTFHSITSGTTPPDSIVGNTVYWSFAGLGMFQFLSFSFRALVPTVPQVSIGDFIVHSVQALPVNGDIRPNNNTSVCNEIITGSYDPNDKAVTPYGEGGKITQDDTLMYYRIRFQNTGTDTAFNVVIRDTLDPNLEWSSFKMGTASHDYKVHFEQDDILVFTFNNILLPDSNVNEPGSHGHVTYYMEHNGTLPIGAEIKNSAAIYFDFNPPIITNTVVSKIQDPDVSVRNLPTFSARIYPNPTENQTIIDAGNTIIQRVAVTDINGKELYYKESINENRHRLNLDVPAGIYLVQVYAEEGMVTKMMVVR